MRISLIIQEMSQTGDDSIFVHRSIGLRCQYPTSPLSPRLTVGTLFKGVFPIQPRAAFRQIRLHFWFHCINHHRYSQLLFSVVILGCYSWLLI